VGTAASAVHAQLGRTNDFASPLSQADERARALDGAQVLLGAELHGARSELGGAPLLALIRTSAKNRVGCCDVAARLKRG
jgi:hypothetical protein